MAHKFPKREVDKLIMPKLECMTKFNEEVTLIIKTFKRPTCLARLIKSVRKRYLDMHILIADDSELHRMTVEEFNDHGFGHAIKYWKLPFYVGAGAGRNFLLSKVETPYFILCDDDFIFIDETVLENFYKLITTEKMDVVGGFVIGHSYNIQAEYDNGMLILNKDVPVAEINGIKYYDIIMNFFIAKTQLMRNVGWMPELKTVSHIDIFLNLKERGNVKVAFTNNVIIDHKHETENDYSKYRRDIYKYYDILKGRFGIEDIFYKIGPQIIPFTKGK